MREQGASGRASVDAECRPYPPRWTWYWRLLAIAVGGVLVGLLTTAASLQPATRGYGTHQQLGLPPCTVTVLFEIRCPSCGMTTSWSYFMRGQIGSSMRANVGGALLAAVSLLSGPWLLLCGVTGRWLGWTPRDTVVLGVSLAIMIVTIVDWGARLLLG